MLESLIGFRQGGARGKMELGGPLTRKPTIGLALGGGAARGFAHIGILRTLLANGIVPDIVVGTSIGAVVGGSYAAGHLDTLEAWARGLLPRNIFSYLDIRLNGSGLIGGSKLAAQLQASFGDVYIDELPLKFAAVSTEVNTGHEIWVTNGKLVDAVRASYALPGIFEPVRAGGRWLLDGALVNPVPVTACRALGADMVIAVNVNADSLGRGTVIQDHVRNRAQESDEAEEASGQSARRSRFIEGAAGAPGMATVMIDAFNITQDRIARSRLAGDPPDLMIGVKLGRIGLFEFHRADEAIALGREAARRAIPDIRDQLALMPKV